jgi:hypothetical protein
MSSIRLHNIVRVEVISGISPGKYWDDTLKQILANSSQIHALPIIHDLNRLYTTTAVGKALSNINQEIKCYKNASF